MDKYKINRFPRIPLKDEMSKSRSKYDKADLAIAFLAGVLFAVVVSEIIYRVLT